MFVALGGHGQIIQRDNTHFRKGPGCFYPLIGVLNHGAKIAVNKNEEGWASISCENKDGWVSSNALKTKATEQKSSFGSFDFENTSSGIISKASASGAVKGFAQKYIKYKSGDNSFLEYFDTPIINAREYNIFKAQTYQGRKVKKLRRRYKKLINDPEDFHISMRLEKIGLATAGQIASVGLVKDEAKLKYLNHMGTLIVENTELYYYPMKFFILDDDRPTAYATPVGMIFISSGLLDMIENEAELACILGHEIAHVVSQHGYKEMGHRKEMIASEGAFAAMEDEIPGEMSESEAELEELSMNIYEAATAPRQLEYEYEADQLGAAYAYRAGYDPKGLAAVLTRLSNATTMDYENFESNYEGAYIKDRVVKLTRFVNSKLGSHSDWNVTNRARYQSAF